MSSGGYLYRVQIVEYPQGALIPSPFDPDVMGQDPNWKPQGWQPSDYYVKRMGTERFIWPTTSREWKSRSSAARRKQLIESFGAKCIIQRSSEIRWPADGYERFGAELVALAKAIARGGDA
ncbi:hypothetical protein ACQP1O_42835 (plasmid) [Nocardia sp. CA-151230]|uniref:hypothetical protein n=1 Tax=Nocardia sp. CA-151230 TaxID=3239982 RepID=UPI003D936572